MENTSNTTKGSNEFYKLLCPVILFRYFIQKNYEGIEISNEECDLIRLQFAEYLESLNLTEKQKINILPKNEFDVMLNLDHPLRMNGFSPAYVYHFAEFIKKQQN